MKTVTICGSMRYEAEMQKAAFILEAEYGFNVLQCTYGNGDITDGEKENIVKAHYKKIDLSDAIYVVDLYGYIGESVKQEINYVKSNNKVIFYHSKFLK